MKKSWDKLELAVRSKKYRLTNGLYGKWSMVTIQNLDNTVQIKLLEGFSFVPEFIINGKE